MVLRDGLWIGFAIQIGGTVAIRPSRKRLAVASGPVRLKCLVQSERCKRVVTRAVEAAHKLSLIQRKMRLITYVNVNGTSCIAKHVKRGSSVAYVVDIRSELP